MRPNYTLVRPRSFNNLRYRLDRFQAEHLRIDNESLYRITPTPEAMNCLNGVMASYAGHFKWADTSRLRRSCFVRYPWLNALFYLDGDSMPQ